MTAVATKYQKFLAALITPFQDLEDANQQLLVERRIDTAVGVQLDIIGKLVGCAREGVTDDEIYRRRIRATVCVNKSDGIIEDILTVSDLVVYDDDAYYHVTAVGIAAVELVIEDIVVEYELAGVLIKLLRRTVSGGVRLVLEFWTATEDEMFAFSDDATDEDDAVAGWSDDTDPTSGGDMASALE